MKLVMITIKEDVILIVQVVTQDTPVQVVILLLPQFALKYVGMESLRYQRNVMIRIQTVQMDALLFAK